MCVFFSTKGKILMSASAALSFLEPLVIILSDNQSGLFSTRRNTFPMEQNPCFINTKVTIPMNRMIVQKADLTVFIELGTINRVTYHCQSISSNVCSLFLKYSLLFLNGAWYVDFSPLFVLPAHVTYISICQSYRTKVYKEFPIHGSRFPSLLLFVFCLFKPSKSFDFCNPSPSNRSIHLDYLVKSDYNNIKRRCSYD